jgi:hypothetical protein
MAISIRGFNNRYSDKVLVLVDGRSVSTPSFSAKLQAEPQFEYATEMMLTSGFNVFGSVCC